jgi:hypothetical protein
VHEVRQLVDFPDAAAAMVHDHTRFWQELVVRSLVGGGDRAPEGRLRTSAAIAALCDASRRGSIT